MSRQILAIGGGSLDSVISDYLLSLGDGKRIAFLPQASCESQVYIKQFIKVFEHRGCKAEIYSFFGNVKVGWEERILDNDIIYVGGGNTKSMLGVWKIWGVDKVLRDAYKRGIVLGGSSAGAICWFKQGITDSEDPITTIDAMNFLPYSCCPHFDSEVVRQNVFRNTVKEKKIISGYALCDETALHFVSGKIKTAVKSENDKYILHITPELEEKVECKLI